MVVCKACQDEYKNLWRLNNPEKQLEYNRKYFKENYAKHGDIIRARSREWKRQQRANALREL